ncbi:MAG: hypothetical protein KC635_06535, partial [Myxococcales bacterium]|nr:hypothetical protein [Myxococcales bacterium]
EACDDGPDNGTYGHCAADCAGPGPACGDGVAQRAFGEACDHGADNGTYGHCAADCAGLGPHCGDGVTQAPEEVCDDGDDNGVPGKCRADCGGRSLPWPVTPTTTAAATLRDGATCDEHDWLAKYLRYRRRLRGDGTAAYPGFVSIGAAPGQSMPASRREPGTHCAGNWQFEQCPRADLPDAQGLYKWGDGTIWLGGYLEVLGMERAVFADLGLDTAETERDLFLALMAFDRLDLEAEDTFPKPATLDGFFLRDDVPRDFVTTAAGAWRFPRAEPGIAGYECVASDISCEPPSVEKGSFVSQDQVIGLLHGLALVARFVPDGVVVDGVDLRHKAREIVHRMVAFLRDGGWRVTDPNGDHPPDAWGGNAIGFSNQLAKSANAIAAPDFGVDDYRTLASRTVGEAAWAGIVVIWGETHNYNRTMALKLNAITNDWSADTTARRAVGDGKDLYALTHALLNDVAPGAAFAPWRVESMLDGAPCGGPCRHTAGCAEAPGWKTEHRTWSPDERGGSRHYPSAEFNGLDYMALFDAYYLYRKGHLGFAPPKPPAGACGDFLGLDRLTSAPVPAGATYDPAAACVAADVGRRFCGRSFASWLDAAYRGEATIWTNGARWRCADGAPCVLDTASGDDHTGGDDLILGSTGADALRGGDGDDCLVGLDGDDVLEGGQGYDELHGGPGNDRLYGEGSGWIILDGEQDELYGEDGDDLLEGGPDDDALYGGPGRDTLDGGGGDDILEGGDGDDELHGRGGDDTLDGGAGADSLIGDGGDDTLWGGPGRDKLDGEAGADSLDGEDGDDFLRGGDGDDTLAGGTGLDRLCGNGGDDTLWGGWDGDTCRGGGFLGGHDTVSGCDDDSASQGECDNGAFDAW